MIRFITFLSIVVGLPIYSNDPSGADFQVDRDLFNQLYEESLQENKVDAASLSTGLQLSVGGSLLSLSELTLTNDYFEINYATGLESLPTVDVGMALPLKQWGPISVSGLLGVGYSYKEAIQKAVSKKTTSNAERTTLITLHRLPLSIGGHVDYSIAGFRQVRPFATVKMGAEWFYQSATLDGLKQGFWLPFWEWGGGLTFFEGAPQSWFRGISVAVSLHEALGTAQRLRAFSFDLGMNILL